MKAGARSWWEVVKALGNLAWVTLRLFWRDPARMLAATGRHYLGNKAEARRLIRKIEDTEK